MSVDPINERISQFCINIVRLKWKGEVRDEDIDDLRSLFVDILIHPYCMTGHLKFVVEFTFLKGNIDRHLEVMYMMFKVMNKREWDCQLIMCLLPEIREDAIAVLKCLRLSLNRCLSSNLSFSVKEDPEVEASNRNLIHRISVITDCIEC